jgi:hypothetical protein
MLAMLWEAPLLRSAVPLATQAMPLAVPWVQQVARPAAR